IASLVCAVWRLHSNAFITRLLWDADAKATALGLRNLGAEKVIIAGYSWGGQTAANLADELRKLSVEVPAMVLADPVRRVPLLSARWVSLNPKFSSIPFVGDIQIPINVKNDYSCVQKIVKTQGWRLKVDSNFTKFGCEVLLPTFHHVTMDDAPPFHTKVIQVVLNHFGKE